MQASKEYDGIVEPQINSNFLEEKVQSIKEDNKFLKRIYQFGAALHSDSECSLRKAKLFLSLSILQNFMLIYPQTYVTFQNPSPLMQILRKIASLFSILDVLVMIDINVLRPIVHFLVLIIALGWVGLIATLIIKGDLIYSKKVLLFFTRLVASLRLIFIFFLLAPMIEILTSVFVCKDSALLVECRYS